MLLRSISLISMLFVSACTYQHTTDVYDKTMANAGLNDRHDYVRQGDWVLARDVQLALFPLADDAAPDTPRTALELNRVVIHEFTSAFAHATVFDTSTEAVPALLHEAFYRQCNVAVVVRLVDVNNQLNTWNEWQEGSHQHPDKSRGRDELTLQFLIFETQTQRLLDRITLTSEAAYFKSDDAIPLDLIAEAVQRFVDDISPH